MNVHSQTSLSVSIILNLYNAEKLLGGFLNQLLEQSDQDFELVIVDDGSTDTTVEVARSFAAKFQKLRIEEMPHVGLPAARARGVEIASGDICIILDVDEVIEDRDLIAKFVEPFSDPRVAAVGGSKRPIGEGWLAEAQRLDRLFRQKMRKTGKNGQSWLVMGGIFAIRRQAVLSVGGMSKSRFLVEDTDISMKLRKKGWLLLVRDDIAVSHPDPITVKGAFQRAIVQGERIFYVLCKYPEVALNARFLLAYTPLWVLLTLILSWKITALLTVLSFVTIQAIYSRVPSSFLGRVYGWVLLWLNGIGVTMGSCVGAFRIVRARLSGEDLFS